jgi:hypothetical protein
MKKAVFLILLLLTSYVAASQIEVTSVNFSPEEPQPEESVTITIRLANKGYKNDVEVTCRLFIDGELHDVKVVPVDRRSSSGVSFTWVAQPGEHFFVLEMSYYIEHAEISDTFSQSLTVWGAEEEIDYFSEALTLYEKGSFLQAKITFEQAKRVFEENQETEKAVTCEEYITQCDQYMEANQLYEQGERAFREMDFASAITFYQQAKSVYLLLEDEKATLCEQRIQEINEEQRKQAERPYYLFLLLPVAAAVIAIIWLKKKKPSPPLPEYVPEHKVKPLFMEDTEQPAMVKELHEIESQLDTEDPQTFKSLVRDFKEKEQHYAGKKYNPEEAHYIEEKLKGVKEEIREKGKRLQSIQKLADLKARCEALLDQPMGDVLDAYNKYAQLQNAFDHIPDLGVPEQEEVRAKLKEYYDFIQEEAKSE